MPVGWTPFNVDAQPAATAENYNPWAWNQQAAGRRTWGSRTYPPIYNVDWQNHRVDTRTARSTAAEVWGSMPRSRAQQIGLGSTPGLINNARFVFGSEGPGVDLNPGAARPQRAPSPRWKSFGWSGRKSRASAGPSRTASFNPWDLPPATSKNIPGWDPFAWSGAAPSPQRKAYYVNYQQIRRNNARAAYESTRGGKWIGYDSSRHFSRAGWNLDRAVSGKATRFRRSYDITNRTLYRGAGAEKYTVGLSREARVMALGRAGDNLLMGLKKLPTRTKVAAPIAIIGAIGSYAWMRRNKDKYYTHYYNY